jgi:hypothetical protein
MPILQHNPTAVKPNYTPGTACREEAVEQHSLDFPERMSGGVSSAGFVHSNPLHVMNRGRPSADITDVKLTPGTASREEAVEQHSFDFPERMSGGVSSAGFVHSNPLHGMNRGRPSADITDVKL